MGVPLPDRRQQLLGLGALLLGGMLLAPGSASALEGIAVVDFQAIFDRYEGTADAHRTLEREMKEWEQQAKEMRQAIDALGEEIESQRLMLSQERLREKEDEHRRLKDEYETFSQSIWGVNGQAAKRNAELTRPIAEKIRDIVAKIGEEKNLDIIFDTSTGGVVWAKDDVNLTQVVLDDLALAVGQEQREKAVDGGEAE